MESEVGIKPKPDLPFSPQEWHEFFDGMPCGVILVDRKSRIVAVNLKIEVMFGYAPEELQGKPFWSLMPIRYRRKHKNFLKEFFSSPVERSLGAGADFWGYSKQGRELLLKVGLNILEVQERTMALVLLMGIPTEPHAGESCLPLDFQIVEYSEDHIAIVNNQYRYQYVNWVYEHAHGLLRGEIVGKTVAEILGKYVFDTVAKFYLDRCLSGEQVVYQYGFHFKGKGFRQMEVTYAPLRSFQSGPVDRVMVCARDITDIVKQEGFMQGVQEGMKRGTDSSEGSSGRSLQVQKRPSQVKVSPEWAKLSQLTPQKRTILAYVAQGKTNKEIAALMQISDKTVRNHLTSIFRKLRIRRRPEAASFFVRSVIEDNS